MAESKILPNSYFTPNFYADTLMPVLTGEEWKVLSYLCRSIFGWNKTGWKDNVSLSQICQGRKDKEGNSIDGGAGVSKNTAIKVLKSLIQYGIIIRTAQSKTIGDEYTLQTDASRIDLDGLKARSIEKLANRPQTKNLVAGLKTVGGSSHEPPEEKQVVHPTNHRWFTPRTTSGSSHEPPVVHPTNTPKDNIKTSKDILKTTAIAGAIALPEDLNSDQPVEKWGVLQEASSVPEAVPSAEPMRRTAAKKQGDWLDAIQKYGAKEFSVTEFPPDVQQVLEAFCKDWQVTPPKRSQRGEFAFWIEGARDLQSACGEIGLQAISAAYEVEWKQIGGFVVTNPKAVVKIVKSAVARLRRQAETDARLFRPEYSEDPLSAYDPDEVKKFQEQIKNASANR